jgi:hypothetical protein
LTRFLLLSLLARSFHKFYYEPKHAFLTQLPTLARGEALVVPPILGDVEAIYSYAAATFALVITNTGSVATLVAAMRAPESTAWVLSSTASAMLEVLLRTGIQQRVEFFIAVRLAKWLGLKWAVRAACVEALELVYLRALGGSGYVAPIMVLCIGGVRTVSFGDPAAILWLDVSRTVWKVLLAQITTRILAYAVVWAVVKMGLRRFELSERYTADHPLGNAVFRDLDFKGYVVVSGMGVCFICAVFIAFLGPAFITGLCRDFVPNATHVFIWHALECANATALAGLNGTLPAVVRE